ncbi:MAG: carboxypeptidase regulatory-like domain-containing protein, partial [Proteobacteria bacterium]|nr:carboxypeptidase regulatory-like domain-containing protein [Pseudomonadota bacterium]
LAATFGFPVVVKADGLAAGKGVVVTAESPDFLGTRTSFTNAQGYYRLLNLPPGPCTVRAEIAGVRTIETEVVMRAGAGFRLDMSLQLGGIEETVTVSGASPMLDISKPGQVFTIDGDFQRAVPVTGRKNWSDFLELTPGVNARPFDDGSGRMVYFGHGTEHFAHVIQLEGQTGTGYRDSQVTYVQMSTEMIADIEVRSGGVGADQPIGTGLIMNIVTKSGGNQLAGTLGYTYQPLSWNGDNDPDKTSPSTPSINKVSQADFSIGGPIKKDAVWFFGAGRFSRNETGISRTPEDVQRQLDFDPSWTPFNNIYEGFFPYLKLSATTGKTLLNGYYQHDKVDISGMREYHGKRLGTRQTGGSLFGLKASTIFNENASLELVASYNNKTSAYQSFDALTDFGLSGPEITVHESIRLVSGRARGSGRLVETGNLESITVGPSTYRLFRGDLSYFTGSHDLKTGFFAAPKMTRNDSRFYLNDGFIVEEVVYIDANNPALGTRWFHRRFRTPTSLTLLAQEDRDIGDLAELTTLAGEVGLDEHLFRAALESGEFTDSHDGALHKAMEFGVNSVPSVFIDGHLLQGVYDPKALRSLLVNLEAGGATYPES